MSKEILQDELDHLNFLTNENYTIKPVDKYFVLYRNGKELVYAEYFEIGFYIAGIKHGYNLKKS